jgi:hypothetical protein
LMVQLILLLDLWIGFGATKERATQWIFPGYIPIIVILLFFILFNIGSIFLLGQLILFHRNLQKQHLTTYEYIVLDSKKKREINQSKGDLEHQRIRDIATAQNNHQYLHAIHLSWGGICRNTCHCPYFDPLTLPSSIPQTTHETTVAVTTTTTTQQQELHDEQQHQHDNHDNDNNHHNGTEQTATYHPVENENNSIPDTTDNVHDATTDQNDMENN